MCGSTYRTAAAGQIGYGSLRLAVVEHTLEAEGGSFRTIAQAVGGSYSRVDTAIRELTADEVLEVRPITDREARVLNIDPRITRDTSVIRAKPGSPTRAVIDTARKLGEEGVGSISGKDFLDRIDPDLRERAWANLVKSVAQPDRLRHLNFKPLSQHPGAFTRAAVVPGLREPLADLSRRLTAIRSGDRAVLEAAKARTRELLGNPEAVARLMRIAREHTPRRS